MLESKTGDEFVPCFGQHRTHRRKLGVSTEFGCFV